MSAWIGASGRREGIMAKIVLVLLVACALVMLGFLMGVLFARSDSDTYDYDDLMRAYSAGYESGCRTGGWTENREDDEA